MPDVYYITDVMSHGWKLTTYSLSTSIGDLAAQRMLIVPEEYTSGLKFFRENGRMDELMEFLATFVR